MMGKKKNTERTKELSQEEWRDHFIAYFEEAHCSLFGRHMPVAMPDEREVTAEWYAELVMRVALGRPKD